MTTYNITIHEYESGLTPAAVEQLIQHSIAGNTTNVTVTEQSHE